MVKSIKALLVSGVMAATAVAATGASATQLITYGGFETITAFSPYWADQSTAPDAIVTTYDGIGPKQGSQFAILGGKGESPLPNGSLTQSFADGGGADTGHLWLNFDDVTKKDTFIIRWDNKNVMTIKCAKTCGENVWVRYNFTVTGTGYDTLAFNWQTKGQTILPSFSTRGPDSIVNYDMFALDDVSLQGIRAPEPMTWALMLVGLGGVGAALRSRRRAALANA